MVINQLMIKRFWVRFLLLSIIFTTACQSTREHFLETKQTQAIVPAEKNKHLTTGEGCGGGGGGGGGVRGSLLVLCPIVSKFYSKHIYLSPKFWSWLVSLFYIKTLISISLWCSLISEHLSLDVDLVQVLFGVWIKSCKSQCFKAMSMSKEEVTVETR